MRDQRFTVTLLAIAGLLVAGCGDSGTTSSSNAPGPDETVPSSDETETATTKAISAQLPTTVPDPTVFNPARIGDPLELSSFVVTIHADRVTNGTPDSRTTTIGYTRDPKAASVVSDYGDYGSMDYLIDGVVYQVDPSDTWNVFANGSLAAPDILQRRFDVEAMYGVISAVFVGEEAFEGVAAYHFTFDETNLQNYTPGDTELDAAGDFFLAKEGNQVLYAHSLSVYSTEGFQSTDEYTYTMSSISSLAEIALSAEMLPLKEAFDTGALLGIPMPADGVLDNLLSYSGAGLWHYEYTSSWDAEAQFMDFYRELPPTNGWTVTWLGQVKNRDIDCADGNCVIIKNGNKEVILSFDGSNLRADWDLEHRFGPCTNPQSPTACG